MINNIIEDVEYKKLVSGQIKDNINFLLNQGEEFSIVANRQAINFEPSLPKNTHEQLSDFPLFILSNYTYTTVKIDDENIYFEAGFGNENFGSNVTIPFHAIFQITIDESILFINLVATVQKFIKNHKNKSVNVFKNNPNNKRFK